MLISASRRTDIPGFYAQWFMNRVRSGSVRVQNPYNSRQVRQISLRPSDVDAVVFWTKNPRPLVPHLNELDSLGYKYYFQYTLNDYPGIFEPGVLSLESRLETFCDLAERVGASRVVWRYDPIILSNITPIEYHLERVRMLASRLRTKTKRLTWSLMDFYKATTERLGELSQERIVIEDLPTDSERFRRLILGLVETAEDNDMQLVSCCEPEAQTVLGVPASACVDALILRDVLGVRAPMQNDRHQRQSCRCVSSVDIGAYNSCPAMCRYCYANHAEKSVRRNVMRHNPDGESLVP